MEVKAQRVFYPNSPASLFGKYLSILETGNIIPFRTETALQYRSWLCVSVPVWKAVWHDRKALDWHTLGYDKLNREEFLKLNLINGEENCKVRLSSQKACRIHSRWTWGEVSKSSWVDDECEQWCHSTRALAHTLGEGWAELARILCEVEQRQEVRVIQLPKG